jgi:two-component system, NarL family, nitrate/nitrite response regulator NarL
LPPPIRVLLVEDNDVYREALEFVLARRGDVSVVGSIGDGSSAAALCAELAADVAIVDYRLPDLDGSDVAAEIRERAPRTAVLFLSASTGAAEQEAARIADVALVRKDEGVEALVQAVRLAAQKESGDAAHD